MLAGIGANPRKLLAVFWPTIATFLNVCGITLINQNKNGDNNVK